MKTWHLCAALIYGAALGGCGEAPCDPAPGEICTLAGTGVAGLSGDGGPARKADIYLPMDVTSIAGGDLYVVDWNNHRLRAVDRAGTIRTIAGTGLLGDGPAGPALQSDFNHPTQVIADPSGRMLIAAWHNSRIKRFDPRAGTIEDICGTGARAYRGDDGPAAAAVLDLPASVAIHDGETYVLDQANQVIRKIDAAGMITRFAGQCLIGTCEEGVDPMACPGTGKLTCSPDPASCQKPCEGGFGGDGGPALLARMSQPFGQAADPAGRMVFDSEGTLYFGDTSNHRVRRIGRDGMITTVAGTGNAGRAGDGGPATAAELNRPTDLAVGPDGTVYVADTFNSCVRAIAPSGALRTVAGTCGRRGFSGDGGAAREALLDRPYGVELTTEGYLYIADTHNHRIRLVRL